MRAIGIRKYTKNPGSPLKNPGFNFSAASSRREPIYIKLKLFIMNTKNNRFIKTILTV